MSDPLHEPAGSRALVNYVRTLHVKSKSGDTIIVSTHPVFFNRHIDCMYLQYETRNQRMLMNMHFACIPRPAFHVFRQDLLENVYDVIFMDGRPDRDQFALRREELETFIRLYGQTDYVNKTTGETSPAFSEQDILDHLQFIRDNYVPLVVLSLSDGTHSTVWAHRRLSGKLYPEKLELKWLEEKKHLSFDAAMSP